MGCPDILQAPMLRIEPVPAFSDNYIWLLHCGGDDALLVDPGDAAPARDALAARGLRLSGILLTHHHPDHTGGVQALREAFPGITVHGPRGSPAAACITQPLADGDSIMVLGRDARVLAIPGHTLDHIAYHLPATPTEAGLLFCGDTLFAGGCGRVFEGDPPMMHASLSRLASLPAQTRVFCAHEYTLSNLRFARAVEPGNAELRAREARDIASRERGEPTVPSTIGLELATNPFLRCAEATVQAAARDRASRELPDAAAVFAEVRAWKDVFR